MLDAELMMELFRGSDLAHGRSELTLEVTGKGKHQARSWLEKKPVALRNWEDHLEGRTGIGMPPLNSENKVRWGAIDVDHYDGVTLETLSAKVQRNHLPLVVCRSKSGGPHLFLFLSDWVPATLMIEKLDAIAGFLGFGTSEIFPKQAMIGKDEKNPDFGSWINMPYFDARHTMRYGLDAEGKAILTVAAFVDYARSRTLNPKTLATYVPPTPEAIFPDGPPCLNAIFADKPTENRNILLCNAAVYAKKAFPEEWRTKVDEYNRLLPDPLPSEEIEALKKSYDRKDYRYQCSKTPLCNFCDSSKCKRTKYGIGRQDCLPSARSLTIVESSPPIWYLDVELPDDRKERISLTTEQLQNPRLFQRRAMEQLQQMPPSLKMAEWEPIVQGLMAHVTRIQVEPELSPAGQFKELVHEFLLNRGTHESMDSVLRGVPFVNNNFAYFRLKDLLAYATAQRFNQLKNHEMIEVLRGDLQMVRGFHKVKGRGVNLLQVPLKPEAPEPLTVPEFPTE